MTALWILLGILAALLLLGLLRLGVHITFGDTLCVTAIAGPVRLRLLPKPDTPKKEKTKKEKPVRAKKEKPAKAKKEKKLDFTAGDIRAALPALWEALRGALGKTRQRLRIKPLHLSVAFGGALDPAKAAETYGYVNAAMWTVMPALERLTYMPDPQIHTEIDFEDGKTRLTGEVAVSLQLRDLLAIGWALLRPVLRWYLGVQKRKKARDRAQSAEAPEEKAPEAAEEKKTS